MAQFTRFLRPGFKLLGNSDHNTVVAYDGAGKDLVFVTVNYGTAQPITYDLAALATVGPKADVTVTNTNGSKLLQASSVDVKARQVLINAEANSILSIKVHGVTL